jgi:diguanylate cyclase (GGDEF)-like protein
MDLNGLKNVNDTIGHDAGDLVLRAYFNALATGLADRADAYRLGGDEVAIILSGLSKAEVVALVKKVCLLLMGEHLRHLDSELPKVSISAGMVITTNPSDSGPDLRQTADRQMYRAKASTKSKPFRPSSLAIEGNNDIQEFQLERAN